MRETASQVSLLNNNSQMQKTNNYKNSLYQEGQHTGTDKGP